MNNPCKMMMAASLFLAGGLWAQQPVPSALNYQGVLRDAAGNGITQSLTLNFLIYPSATGGEPLWVSQRRVAVEKGYFDVVLSEHNGSVPADAKYAALRGVSLASAFAPGENEVDMQRWIEVQVIVNSRAYPLGARQQVTSTPYAFSAGNISKAEGGFQVYNNLKVDGTLSVGNAEATDTGFEGEVDLEGALTAKGTIETPGTLQVDAPARFLQQRKVPEGESVKNRPHTLASGSVDSHLAKVEVKGTAYFNTFAPEFFAGTNTSFRVMGEADPEAIARNTLHLSPLEREGEEQPIMNDAPCDGFLSVTIEMVCKENNTEGKGMVELQFGKAYEQLGTGRKIQLKQTNPTRTCTETVTLPVSAGTACVLKLVDEGIKVKVTHAEFVGLNGRTTLPERGN